MKDLIYNLLGCLLSLGIFVTIILRIREDIKKEKLINQISSLRFARDLLDKCEGCERKGSDCQGDCPFKNEVKKLPKEELDKLSSKSKVWLES